MNANELMDQMVDTQKKVINQMTEATKKMVNNKEYTEQMEKTAAYYKKWLDTQAAFMNEQTQRLQHMAAGKLSADQINSNVKTWMDNQMKMTNDFMAFSKNMMNSYMESVAKMMPSLNGSGEKVKNMLNENYDMMQQWNDMMKKNYEQMMSSFDKSQLKDVVNGMYNSADMFTKFVQLWEPVVKGFQSKSVDADTWMNAFNPAKFQEMMSTMFGNSNDWITNMSKMWNMGTQYNPMGAWGMNANPMMSMWSNMTGMNNNPMMDMWNNMGKMWNAQMPGMGNMMDNMRSATDMFTNNMVNPVMAAMSNTDMYSQAMNNYNNAYAQMQQMFGPMMKMMTPNSQKKNMDAMVELVHLTNQYNIKMAEMMHMNQVTGMKAMQKIGETMQAKFAKNEPFKGMTALYSEWLNNSDKVFVELFESDEYSKLQGEVASLSHKLKKANEVMMEKMMENIPVITRTEMDEMYKAFYDLRKSVYNNSKAEAKPAAAATATKTAPKAAAKAAPVSKKAPAKKAATKARKK